MGTQLPSTKKGAQAPIFGPCLLLPNGCMDQDATWYGGRPRPRPHCVRWRSSSPSPNKGHSPHFLANVYCAHTAGWIKMPCTWCEGRPRPGPHCLRPYMGIQFPFQKRAHPPLIRFQPMSIVAKRSHISATAEYLLISRPRQCNYISSCVRHQSHRLRQLNVRSRDENLDRQTAAGND